MSEAFGRAEHAAPWFSFGRIAGRLSQDAIDVVRAPGCRYRAVLLVALCSEEAAESVGRLAGEWSGFSDVRYVT